METIAYLRKYIVAVIALLVCSGTQAKRRYLHRTPIHTAWKSPVVIVKQPANTVTVVQGFSQKERWNMVVAYLNNHPYIGVREYAKITGLKKKTAEAELDAFTLEKRRNLSVTVIDKKKMYSLKS